MILSFFKQKPKAAAIPMIPRAPEGVVVWAVGDIHGRLDLLRPLVDAIVADAAGVTAQDKIVVFLGDYIDRGPASRGVIRYLLALPKDIGISWRFLKGNHEEAMLTFLKDPAFGVNWCQYGGDATLESYGLRPPAMTHRTEAWSRVAIDLDHRLEDEERVFLDGLELSLTLGDYFFSHAGARPGVHLDRQSGRDLLWIRDSFLNSDFTFEKVVVHGHTPAAAVHIDQRRIGIDTKAYDSGVLSALRLCGDQRGLLQTDMGEASSVAVRVISLT